MSVPTERERTIQEATEAAREYLYRGGIHYQGSFHAFMGNPNTGLGGMIDLAEVLAFYALDRYDSGHKAGHGEGLEQAAKVADGHFGTGTELAAAIRALRQADSREGQ